jgi:hypothetical protein
VHQPYAPKWNRIASGFDSLVAISRWTNSAKPLPSYSSNPKASSGRFRAPTGPQ